MHIRRTFRCRICRLRDGAMQTLTYIGPLDRIPLGWHIVMRRPTSPTRSAA